MPDQDGLGRLESRVRQMQARQGFPELLGFDFNTSPEGSTSGMRVLDRTFAAVTVANTTTETSLYSFTIPQLALPKDGRLRLTVQCTIENSTGGSVNFTPQIKFGGAAIWADTVALGSDTDVALLQITVDISALNSYASQIVAARYEISSRAGTPTTGLGTLGSSWFSSSNNAALVGALTTVDTRNQPVVEVTAQWGTASADATLTMYKAMVELLP